MANEFIIKNGFHSKGDSQVTGSLTATSFSGDGSGLTGVGGSSGRFGISDGSGSFTYYSDLSSSAAASTAGDVIQMFANYVETDDSKKVVLKSGLTLDGNGYTYTLSGSSPTSSIQNEEVADYTLHLTNIRIRRIGGGSHASTEGAAFLIDGTNLSTNNNIYCFDVKIENPSGFGLTSQQGGNSRFNIYNLESEASGTAIYWNYGTLHDCKGVSTGGGVGIEGRSNSGEVKRSYGESTTGYGLLVYYETSDSTGVSDSSYGIWSGITAARGGLKRCVGKSDSSAGIIASGNGIIADCVGYSNSNHGIYNQANTELHNCTGVTVSGNGIYLRNNNAKAYNCSAFADSGYAWRLQDGGRMYDCTGTSISNHVVYNQTNYDDRISIIGCTLETEDATKNALYNVYDKNYIAQNNVYKGMTTVVRPSYGANVAINVADTYGNTHITSSVPYNYDFTGATAISGSTFSGSFVGDGSGLTNLPASSVLTSSYTSEWVLGADGTDHYTFSGPGLTGAENDPDVYLVRGQKYRFYNNSGGHPFRIQSTPNGSAGTAYNDGVTNNDAGDGTYLLFDVQFDAPTKLYYQCTSHANMGGPIYIADAIEHSGSFSGSFQGDGSSLTGVGGDAFPFTGTAGITGSISITGSAQEIVFKGATSTNYPKIDFPDSINIGNNTTMYTSSFGDVVIGQNANTNYAGTYYSTRRRIAIGYNADVSGGGSIAIGHGASAASTDGVAIGYNASSGGLNSVAIGSAASGASNGVVIGANSSVAGQHSIAIKGTQTSGTGYGVAIGGTVGATGVAVGYGSSAGSNSTGIGYNADATGTGAVAIGPIKSSGLYAISIGTRQYGGSQFENPSGSSFAIYHNNSTPTFFLHKDDISYYNSSGKFGFNTLTPTATLTVSGSFTTTGSAIMSSSNSDIALSVQGSGSTVFNIIGSEGTLFAIEDDLDGTLFTVNDRSGIPMFEVSASGRIVAEEGESIIRSQRPIVTHTSDFSITSSLDFAGKYHIVGGSITCSINTGSLVPTGAEFEFFQTSSAGNFLFITGSPHVDIIVKNDNMNLAGQGSGASLKYIGGSTFHLVGDLT